jgi:hypothetical protein
VAYELEFFEDDSGHEAAREWMDDLTPTKRRALTAALEQILEVEGINVCSTEYGKNLGGGLFEFRLRKNLDEILGRARQTEREKKKERKKKKKGERVLLRLFCHAYGAKKILLISGYDKGKDPSDRRQQQEIASAHKLLDQFKRRSRRS